MINLWIKLTRREKYYVSTGVALVIAFIFLQFVLFPFLGAKGKIKRSIQTKEKILKEILSLSSEYRVLKIDSKDVQKALARRPKDFTLFSFLEKQAGKAGIKSNIKQMKPSTSPGTGPYSESSVEMKLETITLKQLVQYLYLVESPNNMVKVKRISVKQDKGSPEYLTALIHLITYK
jgi:general secretion pathway protein M